MHSARRCLVLFSAAIAAVLAVVLPAASASAATAFAAGNRVGAHHTVLILNAGLSHTVCPDESRGGPAPQPQIVSGSCVATEDAAGADNVVNAGRLAQQLTGEEASSVFTQSGELQPEVIEQSREIINGTQLGNKQLVSELTSNGSDIADWGKYSTPSFNSPAGAFQVHFYYNPEIDEVFYGQDYKAVFVGGSP